MSASSLPKITIGNKTYKFNTLIKSPDWMDDISLNNCIKVKHDTFAALWFSTNTTLLCVACFYASRAVVDRLINNGARIDIPDGQEYTPLHYACFSKIDPMQKVKYLIDANPKLLTCTNMYWFTPLHIAVMNPDPSISDYILNCDVDINAKTIRGHTPLAVACIFGHTQSVAQLCTCTDIDVNIQSDKGNTSLHYASRHGRVKMINHLLRTKQINVNIKNLDEETPLHLSVHCNKEEATAALLSHPDVNTNLQNLNGDTPAHTAAKNKNRILLNMLISHRDFKGSIRNGDSATVTEIVASDPIWQTQLINSAIENHQSCVLWQLLSTHEIQYESDVLNVNSSYQGSGGKEHCSTTQFVAWRDITNNTILHLLCKHLALDQALDDRMHDILQLCLPLANKQNFDGDTPVHIVIKNKNLCDLELLLKQADVDINIRNRAEDNALHLALKMKYIEAIRCILTNKRVDIKAQNHHGDTALHLAIGTDAFEYILEQPCINEVINVQNKSGKTPIIVATEANDESCVEKLLEMSHIDLNLRDINGHTAAVVALMEGRNTIFNMLRGHENYIRNIGQEYKMTSKPRGYALMINMTADRDGSDVDELKMTTLFTYLNFKVVKKGLSNCNKEQILATLKGIVMQTDANDNKATLLSHDCLVVVIMAHGHEGIFTDCEGDPVRIDAIMEMFNGKHCEALVDKPKLFFVKVCRGILEDTRITKPQHKPEALNAETEQLAHSDTTGAEASGAWGMSTPRYSDMLISYATWPGYASYRNETCGSAYIAALCEVLHDKAAHTHLVDMLTEVNEKVAKDWKLRPVIKFVNKCFKEKLQTPVYHSSLRRKLYFFSTKRDIEE